MRMEPQVPREDYRTKAVRYFGEGRLTVRRLDASRIDAVCRGDSGRSTASATRRAGGRVTARPRDDARTSRRSCS